MNRKEQMRQIDKENLISSLKDEANSTLYPKKSQPYKKDKRNKGK